MIGVLCGRLRASRALTRHLQALTLHHLRLGFMVHEAPLPPRRVHEYLRATEPVAADVTLLTVADRLSARGQRPVRHRGGDRGASRPGPRMLAAALDWRRDGPAAAADARRRARRRARHRPGPELGELLAELEAAQYAAR